MVPLSASVSQAVRDAVKAQDNPSEFVRRALETALRRRGCNLTPVP